MLQGCKEMLLALNVAGCVPALCSSDAHAQSERCPAPAVLKTPAPAREAGSLTRQQLLCCLVIFDDVAAAV